MDAVFFNFHKEEDFSSYFSSYEEDSQSYDGLQNGAQNSDYHWLDYERELNGDMGLIPIPSETNFALSTSPPVKEDFNKIMSEWNHLVSLEVGDDLVDDLESASAVSLQMADDAGAIALPSPHEEDMLDIKAEDFDITKYVVGSEPDVPDVMSACGFEEHSSSISSPKQIENVNVKHERDVTNVAPKVKVEEEEEEDAMELEDVNVGKIETNAHAPDKVIKMEKSPMKKAKQCVMPPPKFGGKRIDMARGRYMVDEEDSSSDDEDIAIDVETVDGEEEISHPVLQAGDLNSLLEQFEATETTNMELHQQMPCTPERDAQNSVRMDDISLDIMIEQVKLISPIKSPMVIRKGPTKSNRQLLDFREAKPEGVTAITKVKSEKVEIKTENVSTNELKAAKEIKLDQSPVKDQRKNKQILDALPTELIDRIRASSKRKPVQLIEPIAPTKRRMMNNNTHSQSPAHIKDPIANSPLANRIINSNINNNHGIQTTTTNGNKFMNTVFKMTQNVMLDHDYCTYALPTHGVVKDGPNSAKDSGFSSAEEDEKIIRTQPTIKSSNGKLMVSLLKTNTIKKKLNLEEYKKRLQTRPNTKSCGTSPRASEDDENTRRLKHTEMLMKIAQDNLKLGNKSPQDGGGESVSLPPIEIPQIGAKSTNATTSTKVKDVTSCDTVKIKQEPPDDVQIIEVKRPPKNIVMKTLVSIGTNTEESWGHLEQILQNTHIKISPNSLISSIVEQLPKPKQVLPTKQVEHGEDKTIVFIDTTRPKKNTRAVHVQTLHSSSHLLRQRRRRSSSSCSSSSSSSSSSSYSSDDSARGSRSSRSRSRTSHSDRSQSRSRSRSRSNSRTPSPVRRKMQEMKEVEERRVVYVGKIADDMTKEDLRRRFARFGHITNLSVHFRRHGVNYGFVTFSHKQDAYDAVARGNDNKDEPQYDLSFGGRRLFCQTTYADLDNMHDDVLYDEFGAWPADNLCAGGADAPAKDDNSFDNLLRKAQAKLRNRKL
ncbi:uncharacterized protein srl [Atheta coriaria]|uniref:uncharacterized protein srl n=1 Tax=Dalotia coriaria TaxID=877792 RepID=UPI0031F3901B